MTTKTPALFLLQVKSPNSSPLGCYTDRETAERVSAQYIGNASYEWVRIYELSKGWTVKKPKPEVELIEL